MKSAGSIGRPRYAALSLGLLAAGVAAGAVLAAQTFRTATDVVQLDVSVLDKDRRPVLGLREGDFTVLVDGQPRRIVAFDAITLPPPASAPPAPWIRDVAPDVVTNVRPAGRVVVIMIDDGSLAQTDSGGLWATQKTREVARAAIDALGPDDLAAVIYTEFNRTAQDFTNDRTRLRAAVDNAKLFPGASATSADTSLSASDPLGLMRGSCQCGLCSIQALEQVATSLRGLPQRKMVLYISVGVSVAMEGVSEPREGQTYENLILTCNPQMRQAMARVFRQAQLANVTIQAIDPKGLVVGDIGFGNPTSPLSGASTKRVEFLRTMAETTGGRAVVNGNDMERDVPALFAETGSYYMLGVESGVTTDDGKLHKIQVKVDRPGVEVRTREGFYALTSKERREMAARATRGLDDAILGPLPKGDVPLEVSVAPFAEPGGKRNAALAIVLGVTRQLDPARRRQAQVERVEVLSAAFHPETGKGQGERRQALDVVVKPTDADTAIFEVMSRLPVPPGRYQVRLGVKTADGKTGSVYTYVDVPDFGREPLSMSGLILSAAPAPKIAPPDAFRDLMPRPPTARRQFRKADRVTAFARVYRGRSEPAAAAVPQVTTRLTGSSNAVMFEGVATLPAESWRTRGYADFEVSVPMAGLAEGEYLLTADVMAGPRVVRRAVRMTVEK